MRSMFNPTDYFARSLLTTTAAILRLQRLYPESTDAIFGDTFKFILGLNKMLDKDMLMKLLPLLQPVRYKKLPRPKFIRCNVPNTPLLRNSKFVQRDAKLIVARSNRIWGQSSDDKITYAQKAFDYVLNDIRYELAPDQSAYGTLFYRSGTCYGKINLFAALCRRQGIKTRTKLVPFRMVQGFKGVFLSFIPEELLFLSDLAEKFLDIKMPHQFLEINLENTWIDASPIQPAIFFEALGIETPNVKRKLEKKLNQTSKQKKEAEEKNKKAKDRVDPIYMTEILSMFNIGGSLAGRTKFAVLFNKKINEITKGMANASS